MPVIIPEAHWEAWLSPDLTPAEVKQLCEPVPDEALEAVLNEAVREVLEIAKQLAALNVSSNFELRAGMPPEQIEQLHRLARRFHLLPTRIDYAKALALNGRAAEAEHELRIIRSAYPPAQYERIERDWRAWQEEHRGELTAPH